MSARWTRPPSSPRGAAAATPRPASGARSGDGDGVEGRRLVDGHRRTRHGTLLCPGKRGKPPRPSAPGHLAGHESGEKPAVQLHPELLWDADPAHTKATIPPVRTTLPAPCGSA